MISTSSARPLGAGAARRGVHRWRAAVAVAAGVAALAMAAPTPAGAEAIPAPRDGTAMAAEPGASGNLVLFGGRGTTQDLKRDTWTWSGSAWRRQRPATKPPERRNHAMASDGATGTVVLFGGVAPGGASLGDTWLWHPDAKNWEDVTPAPSPLGDNSPPPTAGPSMAYDAARKQVVLFVPLGTLPPQTWVWDGPDRTWTQKSPTNTPVFLAQGMAYDRARRQVVLLQGTSTWTWDGSDWTEQAENSPVAASFPGMAYDAKRQRVVHFGGATRSGWTDETWTWDGAVWDLQEPLRRPPARSHLAAAYHPRSERVVIFGGLAQVNANTMFFGDTWAWNGTNWKQVA